MRITPKQVFSLLFFPQQIAQVPLYITSTLTSWKKGWLSNEMKHLNHQYANKWHKERKKWKWSRMWIVKTIHWMATLDMILIYKNISKGAAFHQKKKKVKKTGIKGCRGEFWSSFTLFICIGSVVLLSAQIKWVFTSWTSDTWSFPDLRPWLKNRLRIWYWSSFPLCEFV